MTPTIAIALKRLHIGRFLLILMIGLTLLVAGFILRSFVPAGWLQSLRIGSVGLPAWLVQAPDPLPTGQAFVMNALKSDNTPSPTALPSTSPTATPTAISVEAGPGIVTVLTLTPTAEIRPTDLEPAAALSIVATATGIVTPTTSAASNTQPSSIQNELRNLNRLISVSRILLLTFGEGQPTDEEHAALDANLRVLILKMDTLEDRLSMEETASEMFGSSGAITTAQVAELISTTREAVDFLRSELARPEADGADFIRAEVQIGMIQEIIQQMRLMAGQVLQDEASAEQTTTPAYTPTSLPTPTIQADMEIDQMLAMMQEMLQQMQSMLPPADTNP